MMMHGLTSFLIATAAALSPNSAIVVGGSSGMGKAAATQFVKAGGRALLVSRNADRLQCAREEIPHATGADAWADTGGRADAGRARWRPSQRLRRDSLPTATPWSSRRRAGRRTDLSPSLMPRTPRMIDSKFWTAWHCAKHVALVLADGGSITFVAGVLNRRPGKNCAPLAATNGALEGLASFPGS